MLGIKFIDPEKIINQLEFKKGMKIADFGCGTGYFSFPIARKIDPDGTVWAFDVLKQKIEAIESQAKISGITILLQRELIWKEKKVQVFQKKVLIG